MGESVVVYDSGRKPPEGKCVEFRLLYSGDQLVSDGDASQKQIVRRQFHPQLKQLWNSDTRLKKLAEFRGQQGFDIGTKFDTDEIKEKSRQYFFADKGKNYQRAAFHCVPLIEEEHFLRVSIDILFLRRDQHPMILQGGDIDNRLKTLFDAFRVPNCTGDLGDGPDEGEQPFFVLLQDDKLISDVRVNTDNLLLLPENATPKSRDVFLVIDVKLQPRERMAFTWAFE
jgi:hypothetical protein